MSAAGAGESAHSLRSSARLGAVQALYQMDMAGTGVDDVLAQFQEHRFGKDVDGDVYNDADTGFFRDVVTGVVREQKTLDPLIDKLLKKGWPLRRIDITLRAVLRAGAYELVHRPDVPARVVINEYVDVAHAFFDEGDEPRLVNGLLDKMAREARPGDLGKEM